MDDPMLGDQNDVSNLLKINILLAVSKKRAEKTRRRLFSCYERLLRTKMHLPNVPIKLFRGEHFWGARKAWLQILVEIPRQNA